MNLFGNIIYLFMKNLRPELYKVQSFTYYIPAPPERKSGYREKNFDSLFYKIINLGFEILEFKIVPQGQNDHSGFWVCFILRSKNKEASLENFNHIENEHEVHLNNNLSDLEIEYEN